MGNNTEIQDLHDKIDLLNKQAWAMRVSNSPGSMELSSESVRLAREINYMPGLAHGLKSLGFCFVRIARNMEALPLLQEALTIFQALGDLQGKAVVYGYLGVIERNRGNFGTALELCYKALELNEQTGLREDAGTDYYQIGVTYKYLGNFEKALEWLYKSLTYYREADNRLFQSYPVNIIGSIYFENGDYNKALEYFLEGLKIRQEEQDKLGEAGSLDNIGLVYLKLNELNRAVSYCTQSLTICENTKDERSKANALQHLAEIYKQKGETGNAGMYSGRSLAIREKIGDKKGKTEALLFLASLYQGQKTEYHRIPGLLEMALTLAEEIKSLDLQSKTRFAFYEYYRQEAKYKEATEQLELFIQLEKELNRSNINQKIQNLEISYRAEETIKEAESVRQRNRELNELNEQIRTQKEKLETSLTDLRAAQQQLIQSEKMASLGELTAGIAHEIQNPLNFVNNFSEVSKELLDEMKEAMEKGDTEDAKEIMNDVIQNLEKINHHGKRADGIVKGMLQHSRTSSGQKELTDINALCDEYLRLAYHGLRAKDKSFNAKFETDFDETVGTLNVIPQDIGRVVLNLINNAFYAVSERKKLNEPGYEPTVSVSTFKDGNTIRIKVSDNGTGIPQKVLDKIFQPFFTTKPTGQGTGLGLSLSYDIVKAHGGEIKVTTKENEGTEFIFQLPIV